MSRKRIVIMGAAGRDFHDFNVVYRNDPDVGGRRVHRDPDPGHRRPPLPGRARRARCTRRASRSCPRASSSGSSASEQVDEVVFAYSDVSHETVMHAASRVAGRGRRLHPARAGPDDDPRASRPVVAVGATRTGAGKSQTTRYRGRAPRRARPHAGRRPPPDALRRPGGAARPALRDATRTSTATRRRSRSARSTSRTSTPGGSSTPASTTRRSCAQAEQEADVILWDGGNNDFPFYRPDLYIVVADPLRPGDERRYHPGETNVRMADVVIINKIDSAEPAAIEERPGARSRSSTPSAPIVIGALRPDARRAVDRGQARRRRRGRPDADPRRHGLRRRASSPRGGSARRRIVDPRPAAVGLDRATCSIATRRSSRSSRRWATAPPRSASSRRRSTPSTPTSSCRPRRSTSPAC